MALKSTLVAAAFAAVTSLSFAGSANALPAVPNGVNVDQSSQLEQVHYRGYRHCHWRHGHRHCHGGRAYRSYGYTPGVSIYIGKGKRHGYGHRRHHRH